MALVSDIQLQNASVTPPKLNTSLKYTVGGLSATTGIAIGETIPISLSGFFTIKSANDVAAHYETTKTNGTADLYLNNDSGVNWNLKLSGTSVDTLSIATVSGEQTGRRTHFSIKPAGHIGFGTIAPSNKVIAEFVGLDSVSSSIKLNNSVNNITMEWKAETASGSVGTTSSSNWGLRRGGVTIATVVADGIHPTVDGTNDLGTTAIRWKHIYCDDITATNTTFAAAAPVTALNNATVNEMVTVGSTTTELDAEANLLFDGNNMNILTGGGLTIGHTAQLTISTGDGAANLIPELQILGTAQEDSSSLHAAFSETATRAAAPTIALLKSGHATIGSNTIVTDGEILGSIIAYGADGTDFESPAAAIEFAVDGTPGTGDMPGEIKFYTTADAGETLTLAMTIGANQKVTFAGDVETSGTPTGFGSGAFGENVTVANGFGVVVGGTAQQTISDGGGTNAVIPELQVLGTTAPDMTALIGGWSTTSTRATAPTMAFLKSGHATIGSTTIVTSGEILGSIIAYGDDGTDYEAPAAAIEFAVDGTPGTGDMPGNIKFYTSADGGEALTEAMTINSAQEVGIAGGGLAMHIAAPLKMVVAASTVWTLGWWKSADNRWWLLGNTADVASFSRANAEFYIPTADIADVPSS